MFPQSHQGRANLPESAMSAVCTDPPVPLPRLASATRRGTHHRAGEGGGTVLHVLALEGDLEKLNKEIEEHFADPEVV